MMKFPNYEYTETNDKSIKPIGEGWRYWSDRVLVEDDGREVERVAVWRRDVDIYGYPENEELQQ